jgi:hypothetical protein
VKNSLAHPHLASIGAPELQRELRKALSNKIISKNSLQSLLHHVTTTCCCCSNSKPNPAPHAEASNATQAKSWKNPEPRA